MTALTRESEEPRGHSAKVTSLVVILLILFSEGLVQRLVAPEIEAEGNVILRFMWLPVYGAVFALCLTRLSDIIGMALRVPFLMLVVMLAAVSFLWSIDPALSFRRGISVSMTTLFALYLAVRHDWRTLLLLLGGVWFFLALVSFAAGLVAPGFARMSEIHPGTWRGFWFEKNTLGGHMARASVLFALLAALDTARWRLWISGLGLSVALVLLTTSATSLLGLLLGVGVVVAGSLAMKNAAGAVVIVWLGVTAAAGFGAAIILSPETFFNLIGKDATLTGRTDIWAALGDAIAARPWFGYGYGAFWGLDSEPADWIRKAVDWDAPTAHNGWLDIALSLGLIGLALFVISFVVTTLRALSLMFRHHFGLYAMAMLATLTLFSLSESILLEPNSIVWITYVVVAAQLARGLAPDEAARRPAPQPSARSQRVPGSALEI